MREQRGGGGEEGTEGIGERRKGRAGGEESKKQQPPAPQMQMLLPVHSLSHSRLSPARSLVLLLAGVAKSLGRYAAKGKLLLPSSSNGPLGRCAGCCTGRRPGNCKINKPCADGLALSCWGVSVAGLRRARA